MHSAYVTRLTSRIYKGFLQFSVETTNNPVQMGIIFGNLTKENRK